MEKKNFSKLYFAISILVGTAIGAGVLGIPYVSARSGFFVALAYIILLGLVILGVNLYLGEVILRTKEKHQIAGYAQKYLGKKGKILTQFAVIFGIYSALIAYMVGMGESLSFLIFNNLNYSIPFGILTGGIMSFFLFGGLKTLKNSEKIGVSIILFLMALIFLIFFKHIRIENLNYINLSNVFLPFGVILFSLLCFHAIPEIRFVLRKKEKFLKPAIILGAVISIIFYSAFAFIITGYQGLNTPEVATLALGKIFIVLGIFTMFTSYVSLGNALQDYFQYDEKIKRKKSWFLSSILPIILFVMIQLGASKFFSFTRILSIGGVISGGIIAIISILMVRKAKKYGNRKPEYSLPANWFIFGTLILIFLLGIIFEIIKYLK